MAGESEIMDQTYDVFVSYSRNDKAFVERLVKRLERFSPPKALGLPARRLRVFVDTKDLVRTSYYEAAGEQPRSHRGVEDRYLSTAT